MPIRPRNRQSSRIRSNPVEALETRVLCARTPADVRPESLGRAFDLTERSDLLARLGNLPATTYSSLSRDIKRGSASDFDAHLLSYMRNRTSATYYFNSDDAGSVANYVKAHFSIAEQLSNANAVTDSRLFPDQSAATSYTVQLPNAINWNDATKSTNPEYLVTLNRHDWWVDLGQSYRYSGDSKYIEELKYELASWSQQNPTFTLPAKVGLYTSYGLNVGLRVDAWMMTYFSVLQSSGWTGAANSLMLYKLVQQGDILNTVAINTTDFSSNRSVIIGKGEQLLGEVLPEINTAARWEDTGRKMVFTSMGAQFYADGSHREQSPGYALNVLDDLVEDRQLDKINGVDWSAQQLSVLTNSVDALWQQLSPDGNRPAIGDTYRLAGAGNFTKAAEVLGVTRWPEGKANNRDVYILGTAAAARHLHDSVPDLGVRGSSYALPDSGNFIMRSSNSVGARQINFTAGPKGGLHGHYDYMGFELFGYGTPLIADPGPYIYDTSANRDYVVSAAAHNTISVPGVNPADLENNNDILTSGLQSVAGGTMISASYNGYNFLPGQPTLSRSLWFDGDNTVVIVDFMSAAAATNISTGFTLEGQNTSRDLAAGTIYTRNPSSGGNVRIQSLMTSKQSATVKTAGIFTSDLPSQLTNPATRYNVEQSKATFAVFATVITAYDDSAATATTNVSWQRVPTKAGQTAILNVNGTSITFAGPQFAQVGANGQTRGTFNDVAYDNTGRLHMVFYDRDSRTLKYAVRNTKGVWSAIQTVDGQQDVGYSPSLVIDSNNLPHVAYQDAGNGDLRYAYISSSTNSWVVQTVDVKGSTGAYPSLQLSRSGGAIIAYYNKTNGDLRLATSDTNGFNISTIDSTGDVGRFVSLQIDPNRPTASKVAVAYEDTTTGGYKYAIQAGSGYRFETIDNTTKNAGGYVSMKFYSPSKGLFEPAVSYYDAEEGHLKYAVRSAGVWTATTLTAKKRQGLYSKLSIVNNQPRIFFFDGTNNDALLLTGSKVLNGRWSMAKLAEGGREIHYADYNGRFDFTTLDESTGFLTVGTA